MSATPRPRILIARAIEQLAEDRNDARALANRYASVRGALSVKGREDFTFKDGSVLRFTSGNYFTMPFRRRSCNENS